MVQTQKHRRTSANGREHAGCAEHHPNHHHVGALGGRVPTAHPPLVVGVGGRSQRPFLRDHDHGSDPKDRDRDGRHLLHHRPGHGDDLCAAGVAARHHPSDGSVQRGEGTWRLSHHAVRLVGGLGPFDAGLHRGDQSHGDIDQGQRTGRCRSGAVLCHRQGQRSQGRHRSG